MNKKMIIGLTSTTLALGATALFLNHPIGVRADSNLELGLVGEELTIDGVSTTNWSKDAPIKKASLENGFYTLTVNFTAATGCFKFVTSDNKWFGLTDTDNDGTKYLNVDKRWFDWGKSENNIYVKTVGTYTFKFAKSTIDNTSHGGDIFRQNESSVSKAAAVGEEYLYFSLGTYYNTEAWYDHTVYLYSYTGGTEELGAWPGAKAEPIGYGLYRILHSGLGNKLIINAGTSDKKGQLDDFSYSSQNFIEFAGNYSANGLSYGQVGSIVIADYIMGTITKSCDASGITPISKKTWDYLSSVERILGSDAVDAFASCVSEVVAGKSKVLTAKERYTYIVNNEKYSTYDDYFGLRSALVPSPISGIGAQNNNNIEIILVSAIGLTAIVGASYFLLRRRNEN